MRPNVTLRYEDNRLHFSFENNLELNRQIARLGYFHIVELCHANDLLFDHYDDLIHRQRGINFYAFYCYNDTCNVRTTMPQPEAMFIMRKFEQDFPRFLNLIEEAVNALPREPVIIQFQGDNQVLKLPDTPPIPELDLTCQPRLFIGDKVYRLIPELDTDNSDNLQKITRDLTEKATATLRAYHESLEQLKVQLQLNYDAALKQIVRQKQMPQIDLLDISSNTPSFVCLENDFIWFGCWRRVIFDRVQSRRAIYLAPFPIKKNLYVTIICDERPAAGYQVIGVRLLDKKLRNFMTPHTMASGDLCLGQWQMPQFKSMQELGEIVSQILQNIRTINLDSTTNAPQLFERHGFFEPRTNNWPVQTAWGDTTWRDE